MPKTILLVEDEETSAAMIGEALAAGDYAIVRAATCREGWERMEAARPDLVILDLNLPDGSGLELCRRARAHRRFASVPIVMLTGKGEWEDKTNGFEAGVDHYLVKPFQIRELRLWVESLLRRVKFTDEQGGVVRASDFTVDPQSHSVRAGERLVENLTRKEFDLLYELVRRSPKVLSKDALLSSVWGTVLRDNTIEVHVKNLRAKLGVSGQRVVTVPGIGYCFK